MSAKAGFRTGAVLMFLAVVAAVAWTWLSFDRLDADAAGFPRVEVPDSGAVRLEARKYVLYLEGPNSDHNTHPVRVVMRHRRTERSVSAKPYKGTFSYEGDDVPLTALSTVTPPLAGIYDVRTAGHDDLYGDYLAFGDALAGRSGRIILGAFAIAAVLGCAGLGVLVVTGNRPERGSRPQGWSPPTTL